MALVGGCFKQPEAIENVQILVAGYRWRDQACQEAFDIMTQMRDQGIAIDVLSFHAIKRKYVSNAMIADLDEKGSVSQNMDFYAERLNQVKKRDQIMAVAKNLAGKSKVENPDVSAEIKALLEATSSGTDLLVPFSQAYTETSIHLEDIIAGKVEDSFKTGFHDLDKITGGFLPSTMVVLAARPSMGKTALGINILKKAVLDGKKCIFFSLETDRIGVTKRIFSSERINNQKIKEAVNLDDHDVDKIYGFFKNYSKASGSKDTFYLSEKPAIDINTIRAAAHRCASKIGGIDFILVDYLQRIRPSTRSPSREREVAEMSDGLKQIAIELNCCVIAIAQLSRSVDSRTSKKPVMSDLRDSGSIEQDADLVLLLYREDYYNKELPTAELGISEINVAKNRNGRTGVCRLKFLPMYMLFENL